MPALTVLFCVLGLLTSTPAFAGEIVLYGRDSCKDYPYIFAADATTDCRQAEQGLLEPLFYGATTSRDIGQSCKFSLYTDTACKRLAGTLTSSGPLQKCLPITKGLKSYKITCNNPVAASLVRPNTEHLTINTYFQPQQPYRGNPSGHNDITAGLDYCGSDIKTKPTGKAAVVGSKLASAFFNQVPPNILQYTASASDGGTQYRVTLDADKNNNFTAVSAARHIGIAAFASLMADTAAQMQSRPCDYYSYSIYHEGSYQIGDINMSYIAP